MKNENQPIHPTWMTQNGEQSYTALKEGQKTGYEKHFGGLTKREYFAGLAMQGILANPFYAEHLKSNIYIPAEDSVAEFAVKMADELLKQLDTNT